MKSKYMCEDCGLGITDENRGAKYSAKNEIDRFKCKECFKKEPNLSQRAEVYTRVIGYLRPVNQFNVAKREEYKARKEFQPKFKKKK